MATKNLHELFACFFILDDLCLILLFRKKPLQNIGMINIGKAVIPKTNNSIEKMFQTTVPV